MIRSASCARKAALGFAPAALVVLFAAGSASAAIIPIELTPTDVGFPNSPVFTVLPTDNPGLFGLTGADVRFVDFDVTANGDAIPSGASITNQYASLGVTMNGFLVSSSVFGGPASAPNATTTGFTPGAALVFNFSVPVVAFGAINTSPDADVLQFWSGPNGTGSLLLTFADQGGTNNPNFNVDRFVGGFITDNTPIGSIVYVNAGGQIELDEFIFEVELDFFETHNPAPEPATLSLFGAAVLSAGWHRRRRRAGA
jgi:hypothetical protein